jgi:hypothetical protein
MNCYLKINMQELEKERQKPQGSICTSLWKKLNIKTKNLHHACNNLKDKKKYPSYTTLIYKSLKERLKSCHDN